MRLKNIFSRRNKLILIVLAVAILIRVLGVDNVLFWGEADNTNLDAYFHSKVSHPMISGNEKPWMKPYLKETGYIEQLPNHPPLSIIMFVASTAVFGKSTIAFRIVSLLFGILSLWYIYRLAMLIYGKKAALFALLVSSLSFWLVLSSVSVDQHNSLLIFFTTAAIYHFMKSEQLRKSRTPLKNKDFLLSVLFMGLAFLDSYLAIIGATTLLTYIFIKQKRWSQKITKSIKYFLPAMLIFAIFPIISVFTNKAIFLRTIATTENVSGLTLNYLVPVYFLIWGTILLCGLFVLGLLKVEKKDLVFYLLLGFGVFFNLFGKPGMAALDRYLMCTLPALTILSGKVLSNVEFKKKSMIIGVTSFVLGVLLMIILNTGNIEYPTHDLNAYAQKALSLDWNFYFPITGPSGPAFGISFSSIILPLLIGALLVGWLIIDYYRQNGKVKKKRGFNPAVVAVFLGIAIAQNVFMGFELGQPIMHPDITKVSFDAYNFVNEKVASNDFSGTLYTNNLAAWHYTGRNYNNFLPFFTHSPEEFRDNLEKSEQRGGFALIIDYPKLSADNEHWKTIKAECELVKTFSDNGQELGFVYGC